MDGWQAMENRMGLMVVAQIVLALFCVVPLRRYGHRCGLGGFREEPPS
jgi:hypothetical protein